MLQPDIVVNAYCLQNFIEIPLNVTLLLFFVVVFFCCDTMQEVWQLPIQTLQLYNLTDFHGLSIHHTQILHLCYVTVLALREVWESETPKSCPGNARKSGTPNF